MKKSTEIQVLEPDVSFLEQAPVIDGILAGGKSDLPVRKFVHITKSHSDNSAVEASYRLAYGTDFLYILLQIGKEKYVCRDRGYQNGDGMLLLLGNHRSGQRTTDEYFLFGFWPDLNTPCGVQKMLWSTNGTWPLSGMDGSTQFVVRENPGYVIFELCLSWQDVHPYHPWLIEEMGFDLMYTEAIGDDRVNSHAVTFNDDTPPGAFSNVKIRFKQPVIEHGVQTYLISNRHGVQDENLSLRVVTLAAEDGIERLRLCTVAGESGLLARHEAQSVYHPGLTRWEASLPTTGLIPGGYQLRWNSFTNLASGMIGFSLLPRFDPEFEAIRLNRLEGAISMGSLNTLRFRLQTLRQEISKLKPQENCPRQRIEMEKYLSIVRNEEQGHDVIAEGRGILRRAFRSELDDTLQPYSVLIPEAYDPNRQYPMLVFLHGSDRDDTELLLYGFLHQLKDWIVLAPYGRGERHCYTLDYAQEDIQEAIRDAFANYSIDERLLVIGGFSMGGYGAYRTYYETPDCYRGVAVFSGFPQLFKGLIPNSSDHPDFLKEDYLKPFEGTRVFIFHGTDDHNTPFHFTEQVARKLIAVGAQVTFVPQDGTGHGNPNEENRQTFYGWLDEILDT